MKTQSLMQIMIHASDVTHLKTMAETMKKGDRINVVTVVISSDAHTITFIGGNPEHPHTIVCAFDKETAPLQNGEYAFDAQTFKEIILDCAESQPLTIEIFHADKSFPYQICVSKRNGEKRFLSLLPAELAHTDYLGAFVNKKMHPLSLSQTTEIRRVITNNPLAEFIQFEKESNKISVQKSGVIYSQEPLHCEPLPIDLTLNPKAIESFKRLSYSSNNEIHPLSIEVDHDNIIISSSNGNNQSYSLADLAQFTQNKEENGTVECHIEHIDKFALLKEINSYESNSTMKKENLSHLFLSEYGAFLICKTLKAGGICQLKSKAFHSQKEALYNTNLAELLRLQLKKRLPKNQNVNIKILRLNDNTLWLVFYREDDDKRFLGKIQIERNYDQALNAECGYMAERFHSEDKDIEPEQLDMLGFSFEM